MCYRFIKREEAVALAEEKENLFARCKRNIKQTTIRAYFPKNIKPVFDEDGFFLTLKKTCTVIELGSQNVGQKVGGCFKIGLWRSYLMIKDFHIFCLKKATSKK